MTKEIIGFINKNNDIFNLKEDSSISKYCHKVGQGHENKIATFTEDGDLKDSGKTIDDLVTRAHPSANGNFASLNANGNLMDSGKNINDFALAGHTHSVIMDESTESSIFIDEGVINIAIEGEGSGGETEINGDNIGNLHRALRKPDDVPKQGSNNLITSGGVYNYKPSCIEDAAEDHQYAKVYADNHNQGDPNVIIELNDNNTPGSPVTKSTTIGINNIDNLNRALTTPSSIPEDDATKLITSKAVYDALAGKMGVLKEIFIDCDDSGNVDAWEIKSDAAGEAAFRDALIWGNNTPRLVIINIRKGAFGTTNLKTYRTIGSIHATAAVVDPYLSNLTAEIYVDGHVFTRTGEEQSQEQTWNQGLTLEANDIFTHVSNS